MIAGADIGIRPLADEPGEPGRREGNAPGYADPWRHKVPAPASISDHPAAHINANVAGDDAAREKRGSEPGRATPFRGRRSRPTARTQTTTI